MTPRPRTGGSGKGSGGNRRRGLAGKGPTPKAEDRPYHAAHRKKQMAQQRRASGHALRRKRGTDTEVVAGRNPTLEALRAGMPAERIYLLAGPQADERITETLKIAHVRGIAIAEANKRELDTLTEGATHQGIAMTVAPYEYADVDDLLDAADASPAVPLIVVCDHLTDPRNVGAVVRSAAAFGGHGVVLPDRRSAAMTASAWKTSAGAAAHVPVARVTNLVRALQQLKAAGVFVVGLDGGGDTPLPGFSLATEPLALVVGAEDKGISRLVREQCDMVCSIPIGATVESLNASVAAAVALYEVARQRGAAVTPGE